MFTSQAGGVLGSLFWQAADGTGRAEALVESTGIQRATTVLPDGSGVVFSEGTSLMTLTLDKDRRVRPLVGGGVGADGAVSPDGRWLAYVGIESGAPQIFVSPLSNPEEGRTQVSPSGGSQPRWAPNGRELFFTALDGTLTSLSIGPGTTFAAGPPTRVLDRAYYSGRAVLSRPGTFDVAPDGQRFLMLKQTDRTDGTEEPPTVIVVKNWVEELKRLVPVSR